MDSPSASNRRIHLAASVRLLRAGMTEEVVDMDVIADPNHLSVSPPELDRGAPVRSPCHIRAVTRVRSWEYRAAVTMLDVATAQTLHEIVAKRAMPPFSGEVPLNWSTLVRQSHRWLSIAFTVTVVAVSIAASGNEEPATWVFLLPLLPLALLLLSGLYLFVLPYATKWRKGRRTGG